MHATYNSQGRLLGKSDAARPLGDHDWVKHNEQVMRRDYGLVDTLNAMRRALAPGAPMRRGSGAPSFADAKARALNPSRSAQFNSPGEEIHSKTVELLNSGRFQSNKDAYRHVINFDPQLRADFGKWRY